jgi:diguanylate cyclase (GGDEF)-like protein
MTALSPAGVTQHRRLSPARIAVLSIATLAVPIVDLIHKHDAPTDEFVLTFGAMVLFLLVLARVIGLVRSVEEGQRRLRHEALHDGLTGLANRALFTDRLHEVLDEQRDAGRLISVMFVDLDDFKTVNDTHGHQTGDAVLRLVAEAIRHAVRQADVVGRMGGDEFAVLMPETEPALATAAADRLAAGLRSVLNGSPAVTASIGVVAPITQGSDTDAILRRADQAMYEAKKTGKNRVVAVPL